MKKEDSRHLAVFIYGLSGSGSERRTLTLAHAFATRGHKVDLVVACSQGPLYRELSPLVRLVALDHRWRCLPWAAMNKSRWALASVAALASYLRHEQPDVVLSAANHVNDAALWARYLARARTRLAVRVSNHLSPSAVHTQSKKLFRPQLAGRFYPWADAIIAVSDGVADDVARVTSLPRERITTIYNPVVTPELQEKARAALDHPWFAPGSPPVVLGVGRLATQKDFSTLLRAFGLVRAVRKARLIILGEGKERPELEALTRGLDIASDVALPGFTPNPFPYMARASLLVLSSAWEGLPGVLIEAMACGCPVVSTDCPSGPAEILDGGTYGPLVPVGDDTALAKAILSVLETPPDSERLRTQAAQFSVDRATDRYLQVLLELSGLPKC
ncbi:MAG: glycosyltransferase [candidate division NC10 bacterium]|nr:glycosyltransferase [candidate division NC10 bacterium]MDE2322413.1 glycosyltransferase [candidate division NC10 bacterium]